MNAVRTKSSSLKLEILGILQMLQTFGKIKTRKTYSLSCSFMKINPHENLSLLKYDATYDIIHDFSVL